MTSPGDHYEAWLDAVRSLTASRSTSQGWRERRWRFAWELGSALVAETPQHPVVSGPALYGVWLPWGSLYVGQTLDGFRRLRDLPVGESHHLATTFPPEIWERIAVVSWARLPEATSLVEEFGARAVGLALEYGLQSNEHALANSARRAGSGGWRAVNLAASRSLGARTVGHVEPLLTRVLHLWDGHEGDQVAGLLRTVYPRVLQANSRSVSPGSE